MYGLAEIKSLNKWAASKECKKLAPKPARKAPKTVRMQGREVAVN